MLKTVWIMCITYCSIYGKQNYVNVLAVLMATKSRGNIGENGGKLGKNVSFLYGQNDKGREI